MLSFWRALPFWSISSQWRFDVYAMFGHDRLPITTRMTTDMNQEMTAAAAAGYLADRLGGKLDLWKTWLANDRRPGRAGLVPPLQGPGRPKYQQGALDAFIDAERAKRLKASGPAGRASEVMAAFGIGQEGGSSTGRALSCQVVGQLDEADGSGFVQLVIASPLLVFRLSPDQARALAASLGAEAGAADHLASIVQKGAAA